MNISAGEEISLNNGQPFVGVKELFVQSLGVFWVLFLVRIHSRFSRGGHAYCILSL